MENYHDLTGYVSNSSLNILEKSPRQFKKFLDGDAEETNTSYYDFGTAVHMAILEPERFKKEVVTVDYSIPKATQQKKFIEEFVELKNKKKKTKEAMQLAFENNYKPSKTWEEKAKELINTNKGYIRYLKQKQNKLVISPKIRDKIQSIKEEIKGHQIASKLLIDPSIVDDGILRFNELGILWEWHGIKCKSQLDRLLIDKENKKISIVDIKTTSNVLDFKDSFWKYNYHRQLLFYSMALYDKIEEITDISKAELEEYEVEHVIIAIDKSSTEVRVFKIQAETLQKALSEISLLLQRAKWHIENDKFDYPMEYYLAGGYEIL